MSRACTGIVDHVFSACLLYMCEGLVVRGRVSHFLVRAHYCLVSLKGLNISWRRGFTTFLCPRAAGCKSFGGGRQFRNGVMPRDNIGVARVARHARRWALVPAICPRIFRGRGDPAVARQVRQGLCELHLRGACVYPGPDLAFVGSPIRSADRDALRRRHTRLIRSRALEHTGHRSTS